MVTLEKIIKMRTCTGATFHEAKSALEATDGDLEAAILLYEKQKAQKAPGFDSHTAQTEEKTEEEPHKAYSKRQTSPPGAGYQDQTHKHL